MCFDDQKHPIARRGCHHRGITSEVLNVTFNCTDAEEMAACWSKVVGRQASHVEMPGNPFWILPMDGGVRLVFVTVETAKRDKNRVHLDIVPKPNTTQTDELARLLSLGATVVDDRRTLEPGGWIILADPEGTEFCLEAGHT
jgi:Glyoxalase-like domain